MKLQSKVPNDDCVLDKFAANNSEFNAVPNLVNGIITSACQSIFHKDKTEESRFRGRVKWKLHKALGFDDFGMKEPLVGAKNSPVD